MDIYRDESMVWDDKMIKRLLIVALLLSLVTTPLVALASSIGAARYYGVIQISNNSTATTNVATTASINTTNLINGNYLNSSANNCVMQTSSGADVPFMPGYTTDNYPWCIWVPSIGDYGYQSDILYTANSSGGEIRYFPGTGGMTTPDNDATLELGDNFTIEQKGWVTTTFTDNYSDRSLIYKGGAFRTYVSGSENVTSAITDNTSEAIRESYIAGDDIGDQVVGVNWKAQTFTTTVGYVITKVNLKIFDGLGDPGNLYVGIRRTVAGKPAGDDLATGTKAMNGTTENWYDITFITPYPLEPYTQYAIVARVPGGDGSNYCRWKADQTDPTYTKGTKLQSLDSGITWTVFSSVDYMFETYGYDEVAVTATGVSSDERIVRTTQELALDFDGSDDYVDCASASSLDNVFDAGGTMEAWIYLTGWGEDDLGRIVDKGLKTVLLVSGAAGKKELGLYIDFDGVTDGFWTSPTDSLTLNEWYHVAVTYNSSSVDNNPLLFINGTSQVVAEDTTPVGTRISDAADNFYIGNNAATDKAYDGLIALVRVYDRTLTPSEVLEHYSSIYNNETGLVARWDIDEGSGNTLYDASTYSNDGAITEATWTTGPLKIYIDDTLRDVDDGVSVPNNSANWTFMQNNVMPYMEYQKIWIGGVLRQHIEWEYDDEFTDLSGNSNPATPSFRSASSDADVSAELISFQPVLEAKAPDYVLGEAPGFIDPSITGNVTGTFTTTPRTGTFPLANVIAEIATATDPATPAQLPLLIIAVFCILAVSLSISATMRQYGSGSLLVKIMVIAGMMGIFVALQNFSFDFWMVFVFLTIGIALAFASKQLGWS